ncbi:MAG TPA: hypothetical protein VII33_12950 [Nakamurella sp.]
MATHTPTSVRTMPTAVVGPAGSCRIATASTVAAIGSTMVSVTVSLSVSTASPAVQSAYATAVVTTPR